MPGKQAIHVTITGRPNSGKTGVMKLILDVLKANKIEVEAYWGLDGPPVVGVDPNFDKKRINAIANKSKVMVSEIQARRTTNSEEIDGVLIQTVVDKEKGYGVRLTVSSFPLESWFGNFGISKERARMVATRLAAEFDVEIIDLIPRDYEWVQPQ